MAEWIKTNKVYVIGGAIAFGAMIYYFLMPPQETGNVPDINEEWIEARENPPQNPAKEEAADVEQPEAVIVDVKGAVNQPGVYEAKEGDRVIDVLEKAGGLIENADSNQINFAMRVSDEMIIYIPAVGEVPTETMIVEGSSSGSANQDDGRINLNKADETELQTLPGIGPSKAAAIIEYREINGSFQAIEDLKSIAGIGDKTFEKLKDLIKIQ